MNAPLHLFEPLGRKLTPAVHAETHAPERSMTWVPGQVAHELELVQVAQLCEAGQSVFVVVCACTVEVD